MSLNQLYQSIPGLREFVSSRIKKPLDIPDPLLSAKYLFGLVISVYIVNKTLQNYLGFKNLKSSLEESFNFISLIVYLSIYTLFRNQNSNISWLFMVAVIAGSFIPTMMAGASDLKETGYIINVGLGILFLVGFLSGFWTSWSINPIYISIGVLLLVAIAMAGIPNNKRLETVHMNDNKQLIPGSTMMIISPKLRIGSPLIYFLATIITSQMNNFVGQLISGVFLGAFISSISLYGNIWLFTDPSTLRPVDSTIKLNNKMISEIQSNSDIENMKWILGLVILIMILVIFYVAIQTSII